MKTVIIVSAFLFTIGLTLAGFFVGQGIIKSKTADTFVTVKGLSEREVQADRAIWPVTFSVASNELQDLKKTLEQQSRDLNSYFIRSGLKATSISIGVPNITDTKASYYGGNGYQPFRYIGKGKITIQTDDIPAINQAMSNITELLGNGIVIEQDEYRNRIEYSYTKLNDIKPDMIREATENARLAAEQFASDANATIGSIRKASQGYFSISDRDQNTPFIKNIRVVTTVEYYLE